MTQITFLTKDQIAQRSDDLLREAGVDLEELRRRAALYQPSPEQALIRRELDGLKFLASA